MVKNFSRSCSGAAERMSAQRKPRAGHAPATRAVEHEAGRATCHERQLKVRDCCGFVNAVIRIMLDLAQLIHGDDGGGAAGEPGGARAPYERREEEERKEKGQHQARSAGGAPRSSNWWALLSALHQL